MPTAPEHDPSDRDATMPDRLRSAVERTVAATVAPRERAQELLDEATRVGHGARAEVARRGQEAREAPATLSAKLAETLSSLKLATAEDVAEVAMRLGAIERRLAELERAVLADRARPTNPKPPVEG